MQSPDHADHADRARGLRVVFLIDHLGLGGAEEITAAYLPHLRTLGLRPRVVCFNASGGTRLIDELRQGGTPVEVLGIRRSGDPRALVRFAGAVRRGGADVIHAQLELAQVVGPAVGRLLRIPSVVTLHTMSTRGLGRRAGLRAAASGAVVRRLSHRIIAVSHEAARHHAEVEHVPAARISTIHNGIDVARFRRSGAADGARAGVRAEFGMPAGAPLLVTVAALREPKGIGFLIRAMPEILGSVPEARYLVVGDGSHRAALEELARREGVGDRVVFAGARTDVPRLLHAADVFVLPTLTEALPTVVAEAMAAEAPVVASRVGGIPEMIDDGVSGLLLEPGDPRALAAACAGLLADPARARRLAAEGLQVVARRFDMARQAALLACVYADLAEARRPR